MFPEFPCQSPHGYAPVDDGYPSRHPCCRPWESRGKCTSSELSCYQALSYPHPGRPLPQWSLAYRLPSQSTSPRQTSSPSFPALSDSPPAAPFCLPRKYLHPLPRSSSSSNPTVAIPKPSVASSQCIKYASSTHHSNTSPPRLNPCICPAGSNPPPMLVRRNVAPVPARLSACPRRAGLDS